MQMEFAPVSYTHLADGAFLQKVHQTQQLRRQTGRSRGHVEERFQLCTCRFGIAGQHHAHAGAAAPAKGHQHHAAQLYGVLPPHRKRRITFEGAGRMPKTVGVAVSNATFHFDKL